MMLDNTPVYYGNPSPTRDVPPGYKESSEQLPSKVITNYSNPLGKTIKHKISLFANIFLYNPESLNLTGPHSLQLQQNHQRSFEL